MFKRVPAETKQEILEKVKGGTSVAQTAAQYAVSTATIYTWLSNQIRPEISVIEYNRLKKGERRAQTNHRYHYSRFGERKKK